MCTSFFLCEAHGQTGKEMIRPEVCMYLVFHRFRFFFCLSPIEVHIHDGFIAKCLIWNLDYRSALAKRTRRHLPAVVSRQE